MALTIMSYKILGVPRGGIEALEKCNGICHPVLPMLEACLRSRYFELLCQKFWFILSYFNTLIVDLLLEKKNVG